MPVEAAQENGKDAWWIIDPLCVRKLSRELVPAFTGVMSQPEYQVDDYYYKELGIEGAPVTRRFPFGQRLQSGVSEIYWTGFLPFSSSRMSLVCLLALSMLKMLCPRNWDTRWNPLLPGHAGGRRERNLSCLSGETLLE